jgi:glutathione S-transferase
MIELVIGSKNYSSWSLRPWLALTHAGIPFRETVISFHQPDWREQVHALSPNGKVPLLRDGELQLWESLAILEYVAERFPDARLWPDDPSARAVARSVSAEMHAAFANLREQCTMNIVARTTVALSEKTRAEIARIESLWADCRTRFGGGDFLFGRFSVADAMFAPVVTRFVTYGISVTPATRAYMDHVLALPAMQQWIAGAQAEAARGEGDYA